MKLPTAKDFEAFARKAAAEAPTQANELDVYLRDGQLADVRLNGESVYPTWFKIEFKESGEISAKVKGVRLSSRRGDIIRIHQSGPPDR